MTAPAWTARDEADRIAALPWNAPGPVPARADAHVHTEHCDDATLPLTRALAEADQHRLDWMVITTHVRTDTPLRRVREWARSTRARVAAYYRADRPDFPVRVLLAVETKILDTSGTLDLPLGTTDLLVDGELDTLHLADHQFPTDAGPVHPDTIRAALDTGALDAQAAWDQLLRASLAALTRHPGAILAHPLSIAPKVGLDPEHLPWLAAAALARTARNAGSAVERNSKWACAPDVLVAACWREGTAVVPASDAHHAGQVARPWRACRGPASVGAVSGVPALAGLASGASRGPALAVGGRAR